MTTDTPLLAKSAPKSGGTPPEVTLTGHTACVLAAADALFVEDGRPSRLARSWLRFFGIAEKGFDRFRRHLRVAAAAHDWGKANDGFQTMVAGGGEQVVRHEHLSGLLLADLFTDAAVSDWLREAGVDAGTVLAAVLGHHAKAGSERNENPIGSVKSGATETLRFSTGHPDFAAVWRMVQDEVGGDAPGEVALPAHWARWKKEEIRLKSKALHGLLEKEKRRLRDDREARLWFAAVRAGLIAADALGSAVVRMDGDAGEGREGKKGAEGKIVRWARECFAATLTGDEVWREVVCRRVADLRRKGRWDDAAGHGFRGLGGFRKFQCDIAASGPRVLMTASCGSGKTLAAWNWITARLDERPAARVLFLYPTRATATEGFRDYVSWAPEDDAGLLSGTAAYELQDMFQNPDDTADPRRGRTYQADARLFALGHWKKRVFSATADQFFPFMQYAYGPLCLLPLLAESVVVVDEVHSFDRSMFSTLRRFLREFPEVPVLCMTATLPRERRNELTGEGGCGLVPYPEAMAEDQKADATFPRYHVEWIDPEGAESLARGELLKGRRVLWVSNRVADCQATFTRLCDLDDGDGTYGPVKLHCYHSRFKLDDRKVRHAELVDAFRRAAGTGHAAQGVFGAVTQVCEMSLDLDADVLITDLAPIAALIQRMGRCNRESALARKPDRPIGRVYVLRPEPGKEKPYEASELNAAAKFVDETAGRAVSQAELDKVYADFDPHKVEPEKLCPFLDSGPYAQGREETFRETDEYTVPCVLDKDLERHVGALLRSRNPADRVIDGFLVPVPRRFASEKKPEGSWFPRWLSVASMTAYDEAIGFDERKLLRTGESDA